MLTNWSNNSLQKSIPNHTKCWEHQDTAQPFPRPLYVAVRHAIPPLSQTVRPKVQGENLLNPGARIATNNMLYSYIVYSDLSLYLYQSTFEHYGWNSCTAIMSCNSTGIRFFRFSNVWGRPVFPRQKEIPSTQQRLYSWEVLNLGRGYSEPKNTLFFPHRNASLPGCRVHKAHGFEVASKSA